MRRSRGYRFCRAAIALGFSVSGAGIQFRDACGRCDSSYQSNPMRQLLRCEMP